MGLAEQEITSALLAKVSKLGQDQEDVNYGLLCGIVTEPSSATEVSVNATKSPTALRSYSSTQPVALYSTLF